MDRVHEKVIRGGAIEGEDYEGAIIRFYNRVTGQNVELLVEIPNEALEFLTFMSFDDLTKPMVREHQCRGATQQQSKIKYGVSLMQVRVWTGKRKRKYLF